MKPFTESLRYEYPLKPDDIVMDVGCFCGTFSEEIYRRYRCPILAFEPILSFYDRCHARLDEHLKINLYHNGIGAKSGEATFKVSGDSTGAFNANPDATSEKVSIIGIAEAMELFNLPFVSLMKLNCEGGEYEILETILEKGLAPRFGNLQIQFHRVVDNAEARRNAIRAGLSRTHELTYDEPFIWENWRLK